MNRINEVYDCENLGDVVKLLESDNCNYFSCYTLSELYKRRLIITHYFDAHLELFGDNGKPIKRYCIHGTIYSHATTTIELLELGNFNNSKDRYESELWKRRLYIEDKKHRKAYFAFRDAIWQQFSNWGSNGNNCKFSASKNNSKNWRIYGIGN